MNRHQIVGPGGLRRLTATFAAAVAGACAVGAIATTGTSVASATAHAAAACGSVPNLGYHDKSGYLAKLGKSYTSQFNGYATPIYKSAYANFKFKGKPPYTIGVAVTAPISPTQAALDPMLVNQLKRIKGVKKVVELTTAPTALTTQIQQVHSLLQQHVSFLVIQPLVPQPFIPIAAAAAKAHIPFISIFNSTPTPYAINIAPNSVGDALASGARLAKAIGGKGLVLGVHGIQSTGVDQQSFAGWSAAFKACPGITFDTSIVGDFSPDAAKAATLAYLNSHPQPIAGVVQTAGMDSGIIAAFQQAGRPVPKLIDVGPAVGELEGFKSAPQELVDGYSITPQGVVAAAKYTITQMLAGHDPQVSDLASLSDVITNANLSQYITPGAPPQAVIEGPWDPSSYLSKFFK